MTANGTAANVSTLDLLNDSVVPGAFAPRAQTRVESVVFDPALDLAYVSSLSQYISVVEPSSHIVVGTIETPGCLSLSATGFVFDPNNGLLYLLCEGDFAFAIDPASGSLVANISLGGYSVGPSCTGALPFGVSLALAPQLHDLFALVVDCQTLGPPENTTTTALTLSILDDRTNAVARNVSLGLSDSLLGAWEAQPMAFDSASGQLYVGTASREVSIVDPLSGDLVSVLSLPVFSFMPVPPLLYASAARAVVTDGYYSPEAGVEATAIFRLDASTDQAVPVVTLGSGFVVSPQWLTAGPGTGPNITVSAVDVNADRYALVYNLTDDVEVANLSVGSITTGVYDGDDHTLFFADEANQRLVTVVGPPLRVGSPIPLGVTAYTEALDAAAETLYVAAGSECGLIVDPGPGCVNESVEAIPLSTHRPVGSWPVTAGFTNGMVFDPASQRIYVFSDCGLWNGSEDVCLPGHEFAAISAYSTSGKWLAETELRGLVAPSWNPEGIAVDSNTGALLVVVPIGGQTVVEVVNPNSTALETNISIPTLPHTVSSGSVAYDGRDNIAVVVTACLRLTNGTYRVHTCLSAFDGTTYAFLWNSTLPATTDTQPALDSENDTLYVATSTSLVTVDPVDGTVLAQLPEPGGVEALAYDPGNNELYVASGSNLSELNASSGDPLRSFPLGTSYVSGLVVDPESGLAAVTESYLGTVVFAPGGGPPAYPVEFAETGLPEAMSWTVTVGGVSEVGSGDLSFFLPNGTYAYAISSVAGFGQSSLPATGTVTVNGSAVVEPTVAFHGTAYAITFDETGPADPSGWTVTLLQETGIPYGGPCPECLNSSSTRTVDGSNGTYRYLLEGLGSGYELTGAPPSGLLAVNGTAAAVDFGFAKGPTPDLTFRTGGRAVAGPWCVTLASVETRCTSGTSLGFGELTPGAYAYSITPPSGFSTSHGTGTVVLKVASVAISRTFTAQEYLVTFTAVGLAPHTRWKVLVDGRILSGTRAILSVELPDGTYSYSAPPVRDYSGTWSGTVAVVGLGVAVDGTFVPALYAVTFSETGLASGTNWSVTVGGTTYTSSGSTIVAELRNGSYAYVISPVSGYAKSSTPSRVKVDAGPATVAVTFHPKHVR